MVLVFGLSPFSLSAGTFGLEGELFGRIDSHTVNKNESLFEIARHFDLGLNEITAANPGVDPLIPPTGATITIPTSWILPQIPFRPCLVINLTEFRLYYFPAGSQGEVITYPVGIGEQGDTPAGSYRVVEKIIHPAWHVPPSIRREQPSLPKVVPAGPSNPMGTRALRLSAKNILIHGTDRPWGIGSRSSHGCLRLYPEDIVKLYREVPVGTRVVVVNQPVKVAVQGGRVYVENHDAVGGEWAVGEALRLLSKRSLVASTDFSKLRKAITEKRGYPIDVTLDRGGGIGEKVAPVMRQYSSPQ
ncbi:L,D-transpeptidase family protein [Geomonas sp. Red32]|uniref:L,D-transpeptidase family protein n=1 Tax=Geomonas sp. Red32 TaxID=2912856 RepID=UPI002545DE7F|nr:L,D-transpeptidase family protein [Geomonas sp. Red32]MCM0084473.1 L,D-transpeptidase family protein [Geomonas sp. Red32]